MRFCPVPLCKRGLWLGHMDTGCQDRTTRLDDRLSIWELCELVKCSEEFEIELY